MKRCIIFCAGELADMPFLPGAEDLVIAADGGLRHCRGLEIVPDVILGDFDSLGQIPAGAQVFPVEKDDTDTMLAVRRGLAEGCREFVILGGLEGPRLDHTVANFQTLQFLAEHGAVGYLVGKREIVTVIRQESVEFPKTAEGIISLFCLGADARGVTIEGLQYTLTDGTMRAGFPLGVSNHFVGSPARITVKEGSLLAIWDRKNGFPDR